jgi:hypothetical protein
MEITLGIRPRRWVAALGLAVVGLGAASIGTSLLSFVRIEDPLLMHVRDTLIRLAWLDGEANIPAWFSGSILLVAAMLLAVIASAHRRQGGGSGLWWLLSLIFVLLSLDEIAQLHELSIRPLRDHFHTAGLLYYPWILPAGLCAATVAVGYSRFLIALPRRTCRLFVTSGVVYVLGALVVEALSADQASLHGEHTPIYHAIITVEELLEMAGVVLFIYALLDYMGRQFSRITVRIEGA